MAMADIELKLTAEARDALRRIMEPIAKHKPVASLIWTPSVRERQDSSKGRAGWVLAFDPIDRVSNKDAVVAVDGVPFLFDRDWAANELNGKTLDYRDGVFYLDEVPLAI